MLFVLYTPLFSVFLKIYVTDYSLELWLGLRLLQRICYQHYIGKQCEYSNSALTDAPWVTGNVAVYQNAVFWSICLCSCLTPFFPLCWQIKLQIPPGSLQKNHLTAVSLCRTAMQSKQTISYG